MAAAWFLSCARQLLNPFDVEPLLVDDWSTHVLGWLFYRHEGLHFPLGRLDGLLHPVGTTVGYTDSIPLLAVLFRPLSWALPTDFQYIGVFLLGCFVLNAVCGAWLVKAVSSRVADQALGGVLFALLPAMLLRLGHPSLCAQGLVLVPIGLCLRAAADDRSALRLGIIAVVVGAVAASLHPYLAAMLAPLCVAVPLKLRLVERRGSWWRALGLAAAVPAAMLLCFWAFGYLSGAVDKGGGGFGAFSADLGTFVNPLSYSRLFAGKPQGGQQYEGFAYLGLGVLVLLAIAVASLVVQALETRSLPWRRVLPLLPGIVLTAAFSLATPWTLFAEPVLDLSSFYALLPSGVVGPFRSSGRFIWPLMYTLTAFAVVAVTRLWRHRRFVPTVALALAVALQLADVTQAPVAARFRPGGFTRFSHPAWQQVDAHYQHLQLVPAEIYNVCPGRAGYRNSVVIALSYWAYLHGLTFNSGYVARASAAALLASCQEQEAKVARAELDADTVYVVWPDVAQGLLGRGAACAPLDGLVVCVKPAQEDAFSRALLVASGGR